MESDFYYSVMNDNRYEEAARSQDIRIQRHAIANSFGLGNHGCRNGFRLNHFASIYHASDGWPMNSSWTPSEHFRQSKRHTLPLGMGSTKQLHFDHLPSHPFDPNVRLSTQRRHHLIARYPFGASGVCITGTGRGNAQSFSAITTTVRPREPVRRAVQT